jgi:hypothetical protein
MIRRPGVVEPVGGAILGQLLSQVRFDAEQVAHRVLVLDPIQTSEDHSSLRGLRGGQPGSKPVDQGLDLLLPRTRLSPGRHVADEKPLDHGGPTRVVGGISEVRRQVVEPELSLWLVSAMTGRAMSNQDRPKLTLELLSVGRLLARRGRGHDGCCIQQHQSNAGPYSYPHARTRHRLSPLHGPSIDSSPIEGLSWRYYWRTGGASQA